MFIGIWELNPELRTARQVLYPEPHPLYSALFTHIQEGTQLTYTLNRSVQAFDRMLLSRKLTR